MVQCTNCLRVFRNNWYLDRHLTRITPCLSHPDWAHFDQKATLDTQKATLDTQKATLDTQKATLDTQKATLDTQKATLDTQKATLDTQKAIHNNCKYCKEYSSKINLKRHEQTCKFKDDQVRQLEINLCVSPKKSPDCKTECRYCNKNLSKVYLLNRHSFNCESKEHYRQELMNPLSVNNGTIGIQNNIQNTNNVYVLGKENLDHVKNDKLLKILIDIRKNNPGDSEYSMAGNYILSTDDCVCENRQNRNVVIPNIKSSYGEVKTHNGWKKMSVTKCLDISLKNTAKLLTDQRDSMELHVGGFKNTVTKGIFSEVKQFALKGLRHSTHGSREVGELKNSLKINKLKNREVLDL